MKRLKQIIAIAMVVMVGVVFMPMMPGVNGEAKAGGDDKKQHKITLVCGDNGSASVASKAKYGGTVIITANPDEGYEVGDITVTGSEGVIPVDKSNYSFTMPASDVEVSVTFTEIKTDIGDAHISIAPNKYTYSGKEIEPAVNLILAGKALIAGTDYDITYDNNINAGTATVTATGKGSYKGTKTGSFDILKAGLKVVLTPEEFTYDGKKHTPEITVYGVDDKVLDNSNYSVTIAGGDEQKTIDVGVVDVAVKSKNSNYNDAAASYRIVSAGPAPGPEPETSHTVDFDVQGHGVAPQAQIVEDGGKIKKPEALHEEGWVFCGWYTEPECTFTWAFDEYTVGQDMTLYAKWVENGSIEGCDIELSKYVFAFNNKIQSPTVVKVTGYDGAVLTEGIDYSVEYCDSKAVGTYEITVTGLGFYKGVTTVGYDINPAPKAIKAVKAGKKSLTVKWKKSSKDYRAQTTGYQIKVSTSKTFAKSKTKTAFAKAGVTAKTVKKLKAGKKYYVKMRAYKIVDKEMYFSTWSKIKAKKTK